MPPLEEEPGSPVEPLVVDGSTVAVVPLSSSGIVVAGPVLLVLPLPPVPSTELAVAVPSAVVPGSVSPEVPVELAVSVVGDAEVFTSSGGGLHPATSKRPKVLRHKFRTA